MKFSLVMLFVAIFTLAGCSGSDDTGVVTTPTSAIVNPGTPGPDVPGPVTPGPVNPPPIETPQQLGLSLTKWQPRGVIEVGTGSAEHPQAVVDTAGNALVMWVQFSGNSYDLRSARYDFASSIWQDLGVLYTINSLSSQPYGGSPWSAHTPDAHYAMAAAGNGDAVAVWQALKGESQGIWVAHYRAQGAGWESPMRLHEGCVRNGAPLAVANSEGDVLITFVCVTETERQVLASRFSPEQNVWGSVTAINTGTTLPEMGYAKSSFVDAAINPQGEVSVVWRSQADEDLIQDLVMVKGLADGTWSAPETLESAVGKVTESDVIATTAGWFYTWVQDEGTGYSVYGRSWHTADSWQAPVLLEQHAGTADAPGVCTNNAGELIVAWSQHNSSDWSSSYDLYAARFTPGAGWEPARRLWDLGSAAVIINCDAFGNALIANSAYHIYQTAYQKGTGWLQPSHLTGYNSGKYHDLALNADGRGVAVWLENRDGVEDVIAVVRR